MKSPVIAIGLDAADPTLLENWMSQGYLQNLNRLREQGAYTRLKNIDYYRAETPWTTFLTGCSPQKTGYWSPVKLRQGSYEVEDIGAYDFREYSPFYALGEEHRVAVFDMPQSTLSEQVNGVQVLAWGAHSALTPSSSQPPSLLQELVEQYGEHPVFNRDHADTRNLAALKKLQQSLETGITRRSAICQDLLKREPWDLFLTIFGETHSAGHFFWHLSQPDHPLYGQLVHKQSGHCPDDAMLAIFEAVDQAIGEILAQAPEQATILIFAAHGMGTNVMDLPSMLFLPELLYRFSYPGKFGLALGQREEPLEPPITAYRSRGWLGEIWSQKHDSNKLRCFLRREAPTKLFNLLEKFIGTTEQPDLVSPHQLYKQADPLFFQPARWYKPFWPQMKAFAIPSYSEGYVRINLQGREPEGVVTPSEYEALCDQLSGCLYALKDGRTGQPTVKQVLRTRQSATDNDPKLPDADLVVIWQEEYATDVVDSPDLGRIGPVPYNRTGSHRANGFLLAQGPGIVPGSQLPVGHALDLAPTILNLMGAPIPQHYEGKPLLETVALAN
ncbi:alkaline phosphatase family protein [Leptolyngbya sp. FACHB-261]|uniref:alkaline phosphatase family protein n=1 Tax=Leptolyngbya sp. FACHB-261 TaxID=2692806 RepID=UPI0016891E79|nr:alkaline phosphatase family protein [Leptolyngbya sp. FACHB-261]MBD2103245.1 alkaline phosphatase family protein [Leptolyngbya sp. FACHB-261]